MLLQFWLHVFRASFLLLLELLVSITACRLFFDRLFNAGHEFLQLRDTDLYANDDVLGSHLFNIHVFDSNGNFFTDRGTIDGLSVVEYFYRTGVGTLSGSTFGICFALCVPSTDCDTFVADREF